MKKQSKENKQFNQTPVSVSVLNTKYMKLIKTEIQNYKKGEVYNLSEGDLNLPKYEYSNYFENAPDNEIAGEWMAMDRCKKTFKVVTKIYRYSN